MATSPEFKVYDTSGTYQASTKEPQAAALLAEHYCGSVRWAHRHTVWKNGVDPSPLESFDRVATLIFDRCDALKKPRRIISTD